MITYVDAYLAPVSSCPPFVSLRRGSKYRFYTLTKSSAHRLAYALRRIGGGFLVNGTGWSWSRTA